MYIYIYISIYLKGGNVTEAGVYLVEGGAGHELAREVVSVLV